MWLLYVDTFSSSPTSNCPPSPSSAISRYREYLEIVYENSTISPDTKWPPTLSTKFITLAVVEGQAHALQGNIKQVLKNRKEISIEEVFKAGKGQENPPRLVLVEGAPGIGKSTVAWELCKKSMKQYSLVVLLRLREVEVQNISSMSELFCQYESEDKKSLVEEVAKSQGRGILFVLDGFDELPKTLQEKSFLLDLIRGHVLPASTVLVTSRPSATAELHTSCSPKHIEILGFTQESVEAYASSVFSSEPKKLTKFKAYISASENPSINSLMYVPLNAAIIVSIFNDCTSDALLPHTLTELYTQLCLTILNRNLQINDRVDRFEDLPPDMYQQFLHISRVAFEGFKNEEVIFHTLPTNFVHFGFLDAVSELYGGGRVSYNFLHLTLQEFFTAYHISHLGSSGLEVLKQNRWYVRWNLVWRFVAGVTKLKDYQDYISSLFIESDEDHKIILGLFLIRCFFEAQTIPDYFSSLFRTSPTTTAHVDMRFGSTALDLYALGYCIANFHIPVPWSVVINENMVSFLSGLKTNARSVGVIQQLHLFKGPDIDIIRELPLDDLVVLEIDHLNLTCADLIFLSEHIPHMTHLKKLCLEENDHLHKDGLLKILQQLSHSNVTILDIAETGACMFLKDSPDYYSAMKALICPPSGRLEELHVGDEEGGDDDTLAGLVSGPSSLKTLKLNSPNLSPHVPYLVNNTCLTTLRIETTDDISHMATIVRHNKTLQHLEFGTCSVHDDISALWFFARALSSNNTIKSVKVELNDTECTEYETPLYMKTHHRGLTCDPRVTWL